MKEFVKYTGATVMGLIIFMSLLMIFTMIMLVASIVGSTVSGQGSVSLQDHSVYEIEMRGAVVERGTEDNYTGVLMELMNRESLPEYGLNDLLACIEFAKNDAHVDGILLNGGSLQMGSATAEAFRRALVDFQQSGKFVVAYADNYTQSNYYVASCADLLMINAIGALDWKGLSLSTTFYKRVLDKIGVQMQVVKVGTYKSAVEPYILTEMSDANRHQCQVMADDLWREKVAKVSASRAISVDSLNMLADRFMALQPATDYVDAHLVDYIAYHDDVDSALCQLTGCADYQRVKHHKMLQAKPEPSMRGQQVAVLVAEGDITDEDGDGIVGIKMVEEIEKLRKDKDVAAVVLRVNSGGGSAYASEQIHHALADLSVVKPLVVSMGDYAASGGYYISCGADYIFAEESTLTGSIGIFGLVPNFHALADRIGVDFDGVKTHHHSDLENNMVEKGMNAEEQALMQAEINRGYELFTLRCAQGRGLSQDSIKHIGEGRVWSGSKALEIGLVDQLGGIEAAIQKAAELAELENYHTVEYPAVETMLDQVLKVLTDEVRMAVSPSAKAERLIQQRLGRDAYSALRYLEQAEHTFSIQARTPYLLEVR